LLGDAADALDRVAVIAKDLQRFARTDEGEIEIVDPTVPLEAALALVGSTALKGVPIRRAYGGAPTVRAAPRRLEQVFLNLLLNAADAMENTPTDALEIEVGVSTAPNGDAVIEVSDRGSGVADELLEETFHAFFTTKTPDKGTGLGLFVCAGILTHIGGSLRLSRRPGGGAVASVRIPGAERETSSADGRDLPTSRPASVPTA